ncbi:MAG: sporulation protein YabP [Alicyclobacillaceae bacterium]|nr:sporulation protein YabP [Alicyclobacillaceae bacterium]MCY0896129.1 sporulation protein YabP [Alicyclobacillaceae bacterium]
MSDASVHHVQLENRQRAEITGVTSVESFDITEFTLTTSAGVLQVHGADLHMKHLDLESGHVIIEGLVTGMQYLPESKKKRGLTTRLKW